MLTRAAPLQEASDPSTSPERLGRLARHKLPQIRSAVARNPNAPTQALLALFDECTEDVKANPGWGLLLLTNPELRQRELLKIAGFSRDPEALMGAASEGDARVCRTLLANPALPDDGLTLLAQSDHPEVLLLLAWSPRLPPALLPPVLGRLARAPLLAARTHAAASPETPAEALAQMASQDVAEVRRLVALNPSTPPSTLAALVQDRDPKTRLHAARNHATPAEALDALSRDPSIRVRCEAAGNPTTPTATLERLARGRPDRSCFAARIELRSRR